MIAKNQLRYSNIRSFYLQKIPQIVENLVSKYHPEKIVLFGSMLGTKNPNDIDLFLIKETKLKRLGDRANEARRFLLDPTIPVDLIIYTPKEIKKAEEEGSILLNQVNKGKILYGN